LLEFVERYVAPLLPKPERALAWHEAAVDVVADASLVLPARRSGDTPRGALEARAGLGVDGAARHLVACDGTAATWAFVRCVVGADPLDLRCAVRDGTLPVALTLGADERATKDWGRVGAPELAQIYGRGYGHVALLACEGTAPELAPDVVRQRALRFLSPLHQFLWPRASDFEAVLTLAASAGASENLPSALASVVKSGVAEHPTVHGAILWYLAHRHYAAHRDAFVAAMGQLGLAASAIPASAPTATLTLAQKVADWSASPELSSSGRRAASTRTPAPGHDAPTALAHPHIRRLGVAEIERREPLLHLVVNETGESAVTHVVPVSGARAVAFRVEVRRDAAATPREVGAFAADLIELAAEGYVRLDAGGASYRLLIELRASGFYLVGSRHASKALWIAPPKGARLATTPAA
jgi:hypothetical protein